MDDDKAITPESYDAAESWCNEIVSSKNNDILYNPALFRQALHQTSQDLHFPISVGFSLWLMVVGLANNEQKLNRLARWKTFINVFE